MNRVVHWVGCLAVALILLPGCHSSAHIARKSSAAGVEEDVRLEIIATVLTHMGRSQEARLQQRPLLLLKLTDSEFIWMDHRFSLTRPGFRYAQLPPSARLSPGEEALAVELERASGGHATAKGTFETGSSLAVYKYELLLGPRGWKVISSELFFAT